MKNTLFRSLFKRKHKKLFALFGPPGTGKTTLARQVLSMDPTLGKVILSTTRLPKANEENGKDFVFLSPSEYTLRLDEKKLIGISQSANIFFGLDPLQLSKLIEENKTPLVDFDTSVSKNLMNFLGKKNIVRIFVKVPGVETVKERLLAQKEYSEEFVERFLEDWQNQNSMIERQKEFDFVIENVDLSKSSEDLMKIVNDNRNQVKSENKKTFSSTVKSMLKKAKDKVVKDPK